MPKAKTAEPALPATPDFRRERRLGRLVCGIDEAGRGPLAGPVVAAAVILDGRCIPPGIDDSKKLPAPERELLYVEIMRTAIVGVGRAEVIEIDEINILHATMLAMRRAVAALPCQPRFALVDGNRAPGLECPTRTIISGDALSLSIAAASIIAKVTRDAFMRQLALEHDGYGWERNVGYSTPEHLAALRRLGTTCHHRVSFAPCREAMGLPPICGKAPVENETDPATAGENAALPSSA